ncbi:MAG TPA: UbiD family decarboxylase [Dehalococcoidia bacterium]|nr:UbiD family decarboxylase [Dehalococcoidia bacterium]
MAYYKDFREYLDTLEAAGKLRRVQRPTNKDTELHPLVAWQFRGLNEAQRTGFLFENVTDSQGKRYNCRVATATIAPSREVYALGMKCAPDGINEKWWEAHERPVPPRLVETGPVKEEIHKGDKLLEHGGVKEFAIPITGNGWESLPRLTAVCWHTKDPETGVINVGTYNGYLQGPDRTSCRTSRGRSHLGIQFEKCRQRGIPLQAAAVIGAGPAISMLGVSRVPYHVSELDIAGGIAGEPIEVVKCETIDMVVPANAEIVIEGEIPTDWEEPDAASVETFGHVMIDLKVFAFKVKCITHRRNPIWHDLNIQTPPSEDTTILSFYTSQQLTRFLRESCEIPQVKNVVYYPHDMAIIRMQDIKGERTPNSVVWQALLASQARSDFEPRIVIAVDEEIDPWDLETVFWAIMNRCQPHRDIRIIQGRGAFGHPGYQTAGPLGMDPEQKRFPTSWTGPQGQSSLLIDSTRKWDYTPVGLPKRPYMERAKEIWEELGFPPLHLREPWYGVSLGIWPEKYQRWAELAEKGEFEQAARELMEGGKHIT